MRKTYQEIYEECEEVYELVGQGGVYDYVLNNYDWLPWLYCVPCQDDTPTVYLAGLSPADAVCCVCGTPK